MAGVVRTKILRALKEKADSTTVKSKILKVGPRYILKNAGAKVPKRTIGGTVARKVLNQTTKRICTKTQKKTSAAIVSTRRRRRKTMGTRYRRQTGAKIEIEMLERITRSLQTVVLTSVANQKSRKRPLGGCQTNKTNSNFMRNSFSVIYPPI